MPWVKGQTGNIAGRPKQPEIQMLRAAMVEVEKKKKKNLYEHLVEQAYVDNTVLVALLKKFVPDLTRDESMVEAVRTYLVRAEANEQIKKLPEAIDVRVERPQT